MKNLLPLTINVTAAALFTVASVTGHADVVWPATAATVGAIFGGRLAKAVPS